MFIIHPITSLFFAELAFITDCLKTIPVQSKSKIIVHLSVGHLQLQIIKEMKKINKKLLVTNLLCI